MNKKQQRGQNRDTSRRETLGLKGASHTVETDSSPNGRNSQCSVLATPYVAMTTHGGREGAKVAEEGAPRSGSRTRLWLPATPPHAVHVVPGGPLEPTAVAGVGSSHAPGAARWTQGRGNASHVCPPKRQREAQLLRVHSARCARRGQSRVARPGFWKTAARGPELRYTACLQPQEYSRSSRHQETKPHSSESHRLVCLIQTTTSRIPSFTTRKAVRAHAHRGGCCPDTEPPCQPRPGPGRPRGVGMGVAGATGGTGQERNPGEFSAARVRGAGAPNGTAAWNPPWRGSRRWQWGGVASAPHFRSGHHPCTWKWP